MIGKTNTATLAPSLFLLAHIMRRMPKNIRKTLWWWTQLYNKIGGGGFSEDPKIDSQWPSGLQSPISSSNSYRLQLDLDNWMERRAYFSGTYYQTDIIDLIEKIVRPADQFIDIGANIGFITLHASQLVGANGKIVSFEPNPNMLSRLHNHINLNNFNNRVTVVESALGESSSTATLHVPENHPGMGTLTNDKGTAIEVPVTKGDDALSTIDEAIPLVIKIDVEGFEQKVLSGLQKTLEHPNIILIIEITDHMLQRVGDSASGIYEFLKAKGFDGFIFNNKQTRFNRILEISPCNEPRDVEQYDVIFIKKESQIMNRLL